ncbi:DUF1642 domain-containing protein [Streptococcus lutetiensis]|uniref:DUF1642 domain-containing protein n=1 Tax=Streptococcus lutetiensis TaxID=150055 RepID=UPI000FE2116F|nr:DUF1642 domain-containing protein [Streptococcus lutetiensis]RHB86813.1 DUF1642 domain-containing protein [Streptococcus lutetiensis]
MNKQEFQQTIKNMKPPKNFTFISAYDAYEKGFEEAKGTALINSCFLNEPEKPVVPQFVADMIVKRKTAGQSVIKAIENLRFYEDACKWVRNNGETFVKAWLYGYEVEKEKLYTVEIPNPNGFIHLVLCKDCDGKIFVTTFSGVECWTTYGKCKLTESEIRKDFDWAWEFAEEVKE